jgi:hypothetical protein
MKDSSPLLGGSVCKSMNLVVHIGMITTCVLTTPMFSHGCGHMLENLQVIACLPSVLFGLILICFFIYIQKFKETITVSNGMNQKINTGMTTGCAFPIAVFLKVLYTITHLKTRDNSLQKTVCKLLRVEVLNIDRYICPL